MATKTINLNTRPNVHGTPEFRVYIKANWTDPFFLIEDVLVEEVVWNVAPSVSTATLHYRYGEVQIPGSETVKTIPPANSRGFFVLIIITGDQNDPPLHWLGFAESAITTQVYADNSGGVQSIPCYGMDRVLQMTPLDTTVFKNPDDVADDKVLRRSKAAPFNPRKPGNRTKERVVVKEVSGGDDIESYVFATPDDKDVEWWSTRDFFEYLFVCHLTAGEQGTGNIPWRIAGDLGVLPQWDRLTINQPDQRSVHSLVNETLGADRMLGWSVQSVINVQSNFLATTPVVEEVQIVPFSRLDSVLTLPSVGTMPANENKVIWISDQDEATDVQIQTDDSDVVDQVIVRGPWEIGVGTFRFESEWEGIWDPDLEEPYAIAYSDKPGWAGLEQYERAEWNAFFREAPKYDEVYRNYGFKPKWDGTCDADPLFAENEGETYVPYIGNIIVLPGLPLFRGVDYEGAADEVDESKGRRLLPILAYIERPDSPGEYTTLQNAHSVYGAPPIRNPNKLDYDVSVIANNETEPGFEIQVSGAPQHALEPQFQPNDGDPETINPDVWGKYDTRTMLITAAVQGDRRPEYRIPDSVTGDLVRQRIITLDHPGLQLVHIASSTVVAVDEDGGTLHSDGGILRDPMAELESLARIAEKSLLAASQDSQHPHRSHHRRHQHRQSDHNGQRRNSQRSDPANENHGTGDRRRQSTTHDHVDRSQYQRDRSSLFSRPSPRTGDPRSMNFKPSQVISVVSVTGCPARVKDAAGSGKDGIYYFEAIPEQYAKADESDAYDEIASSLPDDPKQRIKVRNNFTIPMVAGEKLEIVLDENGIGKMIVWPCEEDE